MSAARFAGFLLAAVSAVLAGGADLRIPDPGSFGRGRLERLADLPDAFARLRREDRELWMRQARSRVLEAARSEGFLEARCQITVAALDSAEGTADVRMDFGEGPVYRFGELSFTYPDGKGFDPRVLDRLEDPVGEVYTAKRRDRVLAEAIELLQGSGWLDAAAVPRSRVDSSLRKVDLALDLQPGGLAVFQGLLIDFDGHHLTRKSFLRDIWKVDPGDTLRARDLTDYNRKLYRTRLYSTVRLDREPAGEDSSLTRVRLRLKERVPGALEGMVSYEPTYGWALSGELSHDNVQGTMNALSFKASVAERDQWIRLGFASPLVWGTPVSLDYGITLEQASAALVDTTTYRELTLSNEGTFTWPATEHLALSLTLNTERVTKSLIAGGRTTLYEYTDLLGAGFDYRDDAFDPLAGWTLRGVLGNGGRFGFDSTFFWLQAQGKAWVPLFWRFRSAYALEGGRFLNTTTLDGASVFWQGGGRSVRSYGYNSLRVTPDEDQALRPRYLRASAELRLNLPWNFQVVGFEDWARLWNEGQAPALDRLSKAAWGYGLGLRYRISLLSLRLDYALGRGDESWAFDLAQAI